MYIEHALIPNIEPCNVVYNVVIHHYNLKFHACSTNVRFNKKYNNYLTFITCINFDLYSDEIIFTIINRLYELHI